MEGGLPKEDVFSTKVMNSSLLLHACVSVFKLISMSRVLYMRLSLLHLHVLR